MAFLVLTGTPGSGKTETAKALAKYFGVEYCDVDKLIVDSSRLSISEIFSTLGEGEFRKLEQAIAQEAIASFDGIVALGGGAVLSESTRQALQGQFVVYLDVSLSEGLRRIEEQPGQRPLLDAYSTREEKLEALVQIRAVRCPLYEEVATTVVNTSSKVIGSIVAEISAEYAQWRNSLPKSL